jgi:uncharacterized protein
MEIILSEDISSEYLGIVENILCDAEFQKLAHYTQHRQTTRFMHSLNVSYLSWRAARKLGMDERVAARAGLVHDFCLYDFKEKPPGGELQAFYHPKIAAKNSQEHFEVGTKEHQAILSHMFPLGPLPGSKEAWIISGIDKLCACAEFLRIRIALSRKDRIALA